MHHEDGIVMKYSEEMRVRMDEIETKLIEKTEEVIFGEKRVNYSIVKKD